MKILAIEKELADVDWSMENDTLEHEAQHAYQFYLSGYFREIYFNEYHNAVIILECDSLEKANELLTSLPLVKKGMIAFDLMELNPYTGYQRIMKKTHNS
ncbi:MAG: superoxide dismutase [Marinilabiliales bacterium]|nr:MAG: superoxide dismutase [Marinilabiliales bacterium]